MSLLAKMRFESQQCFYQRLQSIILEKDVFISPFANRLRKELIFPEKFLSVMYDVDLQELEFGYEKLIKRSRCKCTWTNRFEGEYKIIIHDN